MNKIYWVITATQSQVGAAHRFNHCACVVAATGLEAVAIALHDQPEQAYIFWLEALQPQICLSILNKAVFMQQLFDV